MKKNIQGSSNYGTANRTMSVMFVREPLLNKNKNSCVVIWHWRTVSFKSTGADLLPFRISKLYTFQDIALDPSHVISH